MLYVLSFSLAGGDCPALHPLFSAMERLGPMEPIGQGTVLLACTRTHTEIRRHLQGYLNPQNGDMLVITQMTDENSCGCVQGRVRTFINMHTGAYMARQRIKA